MFKDIAIMVAGIIAAVLIEFLIIRRLPNELTRRQRFLIWATIILSVIIVNAWPDNERQRIAVHVQDSVTGATISGASIRIEIQNEVPLRATTDSEGIAYFEVPSKALGLHSRLIIEANGYEKHDINILIDSLYFPSRVQLVPLSQ